MEVLIPKEMKELLLNIDNEHRRLAAGCTDIIAALKAGKIKKKPLIDLNNIDEIKKVYEDENKVYIGSNVTMRKIIGNDIVKTHLPLLKDALQTIGSPQIRNRATLGGNIGNASPSGDGILALTLLDAEVVLRSVKGERNLKIGDFINGVGKTALQNDEFIEYIVLNKKYSNYECYFEKVGLRNAVTISICSIAILYKVNEAVIDDIKIAFGAVAPKIIEIFEAEEFLKGKEVKEEVLKDASKIIENIVVPIDDIRASAEYRKKVSGNLIMRLRHLQKI